MFFATENHSKRMSSDKALQISTCYEKYSRSWVSRPSKRIAYAMDFSSFFIQKIKSQGYIKQILLFGSVARGEADVTSDVDIFIDVVQPSLSIEQEIKKIVNDFFRSTKYKNYWDNVVIFWSLLSGS